MTQVRRDEGAISQLLDEARAQAHGSAAPPPAQKSIMSTLTHVYDCGGKRHEVETPIEPLVAALRPPRDFCLKGDPTPGADIHDYIVLQKRRSAEGRDAGARNILFDLGASHWAGGQYW